jgi:hypothetical protein
MIQRSALRISPEMILRSALHYKNSNCVQNFVGRFPSPDSWAKNVLPQSKLYSQSDDCFKLSTRVLNYNN